MGGGGGGNGDLPDWQKTQLMQQMAAAQKQADNATQQALSGTQLDWFRLYGQAPQTPQMKDAGINAPFSTQAGGFATPFLTTSGKAMPAGNSSQIGGLR